MLGLEPTTPKFCMIVMFYLHYRWGQTSLIPIFKFEHFKNFIFLSLKEGNVLFVGEWKPQVCAKGRGVALWWLVTVSIREL